MRVPWIAAGILSLLCGAEAALAHGGQYQPPKGPQGGLPPDSEILHPRVPVPTPPDPATLTPWERWWEANADRYLHLRARLRERDGPRSRVSDGGDPAPDDGGIGLAPTARDFMEKEVLPVVTAALRDEDAEVRSAAAVALGKMGFPRTLMDLQRTLRDPDRDVREAGVLALGMLGDSLAVEQLLDVLLDSRNEERLRGFAAVGLGLIGGPAAGDALLSYLDPAADARRVGGIRRRPETEAAVLASLGLARHRPGRQALTAVALSGRMPDGSRADATVRSFALAGLGRLGDRDLAPAAGAGDGGAGGPLPPEARGAELALLVSLLREDQEVLRQGAALALGMLGRPDDGFVLEALARAAVADKDFNTRSHAVMALARIGGPQAIEAIRRRLAKPARMDLPFTALALGVAGDGGSAAEILRWFREGRDYADRGACALALGLLRHADAAPDIRVLAFSKAPRECRRHCMLALGLLRDGESSGPLLEVVTTDWDPYLKNAAGTALGLLGSREAVGRAAAVAQGATSILARGHACRILGMIGNRESARLLVRFARDPRETGYLRMFAVTGLGILAERTDLPILSTAGFDLDNETRLDVFDTLAGLM